MVTSNILINIFTNAFTSEKTKAVFYSRINILSLIISIYITYISINIANISKGIGLYNGLFNTNAINQIIAGFILVLTPVILIYNSFYFFNRREISININKTEIDKISLDNNINMLSIGEKLETYKIVEYGLVISFIVCGALFLMASGDLISLFISLELQSYGLYILCTLHKDSEQATWGGLMYFLLGGLSSCFVLLGSSLIYINTGTTILDGFYIINYITQIEYNNILNGVQVLLQDNDSLFTNGFVTYSSISYINISLIILITGFLFKISAAPFHFWSPDVYDAIPTQVTTYVALISKLSIFVILLELVYYLYGDINTNNDVFTWKNCIALSSMLSLIIGSVLGLSQIRIKRLYAYSTISHVGFILLALVIDKIESINAYLFYIISYTLSNLNAFVILVSIGYTMYMCINKQGNNIKHSDTPGITDAPDTISHDNKIFNKNISNEMSLLPIKDFKYSPIQLISQLRGYFYINSYLAISLAITLFSFMGIPPLIGFFAKQMVLSAALDSGYVFITLIGIITSVIGAGYYLNIIKEMFFFKSDYVINPYEISDKGNVYLYSLNNYLSITISILTCLIALFMAIPNESFSLTRIISLLIYI